MKYLFLGLSNDEWSIIGVLVNIVLATLTFFAVCISLWTVITNSYHKGKIYFKVNNDSTPKKYEIKLYNKRIVPITIISRGFYLEDNDSKPLLSWSNEKVKLEMSDVSYFKTNINAINTELIKKDFENGDKVIIYGYFQCANGKRYQKHIKHVVSNSSLTSTLN